MRLTSDKIKTILDATVTVRKKIKFIDREVIIVDMPFCAFHLKMITTKVSGYFLRLSSCCYDVVFGKACMVSALLAGSFREHPRSVTSEAVWCTGKYRLDSIVTVASTFCQLKLKDVKGNLANSRPCLLSVV